VVIPHSVFLTFILCSSSPHLSNTLHSSKWT
jgi:hypothetical protein